MQSQPIHKDMGSCVALFGEVLADVFPDGHILGGAPFNVARHLQGFGLKPVMISRTGNDALREELLAEMHARGMDSSGIQCDPQYPTGQVTVHMDEGGHRFEILPYQAYDYIHAGVTHMLTMSIKPDLVYFGTLAQRNMESRLALDNFLNDARSPRFLDINLRAPWYDKHTVRRSLMRADIVKMNEDELGALAILLRLPGKSLPELAMAMVKRFNLTQVVITRGEQGAWQLHASGELQETGPQRMAHPLQDTVGAGDAFASVYILGYLQQWDTQLTLTRANQFASALCAIRGAAPHDLGFYQPFVQEWLS